MKGFVVAVYRMKILCLICNNTYIILLLDLVSSPILKLAILLDYLYRY